MIVRLKKNLDINDLDLKLFEKEFLIENQDIDLIVMAILYDGQDLLYNFDLSILGYYASSYFEIIDNQLSEYWVLGDNEGQILIGPKEYATDNELRIRIFDGEEKTILNISDINLLLILESILNQLKKGENTNKLLDLTKKHFKSYHSFNHLEEELTLLNSTKDKVILFKDTLKKLEQEIKDQSI